ncbi:MAG: hypothetical protein KAG94_03690 [Clostridiales bacterium]|nr:hypothetical protein [Clostridiales bacterium]
MNRLELLEKLELPEDANREAIEEQYFMLIKRARSEPNLDVDAISDAYRLLTSQQIRTKDQIKKGKRKVNMKLAMIGLAVIAVVVLFFIIMKLIPANEDVNINYLGNFIKGDYNTLGVHVKEETSVNSVYIGTIYIDGRNSEMLQKNMNGDILFYDDFNRNSYDIFVMDEMTYQIFKNDYLFLDLSEYTDELGIEETTLNSTYTIKLLEDELLLSPFYITVDEKMVLRPGTPKTMYIAIGKNYKDLDKCLEVIKLLIN